MMFKRSLLTTAILAGMVATSAHALTTSASGTTTIGNTTATDTLRDGNPGDSPVSGSTGVSTNVASFNTTTGVLTSFRLTSSNTGGNTVFTQSGSPGATTLVDSLSFQSGGSNLANWTLFATRTANGSSGLSGHNSKIFFDTATLNQVIDSNVLTVRSNGTLSANRPGTAQGNGTTTATLASHDQTVAVVYTYLNHANASFNSGTDTNTLSLTAGNGFSVNALGSAANTTTLDTVTAGGVWSCVSGDCSAFAVSAMDLSNQAAGSFASGTTSLVSGLAGGVYNAVFALTFSDDTATGVGQKQDTLTLNLTGTVVAVPEPESAALFLAGLLAMGSLSRRRRND